MLKPREKVDGFVGRTTSKVTVIVEPEFKLPESSKFFISTSLDKLLQVGLEFSPLVLIWLATVPSSQLKSLGNETVRCPVEDRVFYKVTDTVQLVLLPIS